MANVAILYPNEHKLKAYLAKRIFEGKHALTREQAAHRNPLMVTNYLVNRVFTILREDKIRLFMSAEGVRKDLGAMTVLHLGVLNVLTQKYAEYMTVPSVRDVVTDVVETLKNGHIFLVPPPNLIP